MSVQNDSKYPVLTSLINKVQDIKDDTESKYAEALAMSSVNANTLLVETKNRTDKADELLNNIAVNVDKFLVVGTTDYYGEAIREAILYVKNNAISGTIQLSAKDYVVKSSIQYYSNIKIKGIKGKTKIKADTSLYQCFINPNEDVESIEFEDLIFEGGVVDSGTFPRVRGSRTVNAGIQRAIQATSSNNPANTTAYKVTDITITNCKFINMSDLPIYLDGVYGESVVTDSYFSNNVDIGFIHCESVRFQYNTVTKSADNGVSISRGCKTVTCTGNKVSLCAYAGIWISGWSSEGTGETGLGAEDFTCSDNIIKTCGHFGIQLTDAPKNGVISNNVIRNILRGTYDEPNDSRGVGIKVSSYPEVDYTIAGITNYAETLIISDNMIVDCARGGIETRGLKVCTINNNTIKNAGSVYLANGTTAVSNEAIDQNFGIRCYIYHELVDITNNKIIDTTGNAVTKAPIIFLNDASNIGKNCTIKNNKAYGCYNTLTAILRQDATFTNILENVVQAIQSSTYPSVVTADAEGYKRMGIMKRSGATPEIVIGSGTALSIKLASTANVDDPTATYTEIAYLAVTGNLVLTQLGKGLTVKSADGTKTKTIGIDNAGALLLT